MVTILIILENSFAIIMGYREELTDLVSQSLFYWKTPLQLKKGLVIQGWTLESQSLFYWKIPLQ